MLQLFYIFSCTTIIIFNIFVYSAISDHVFNVAKHYDKKLSGNILIQKLIIITDIQLNRTLRFAYLWSIQYQINQGMLHFFLIQPN